MVNAATGESLGGALLWLPGNKGSEPRPGCCQLSGKSEKEEALQDQVVSLGRAASAHCSLVAGLVGTLRV